MNFGIPLLARWLFFEMNHWNSCMWIGCSFFMWTTNIYECNKMKICSQGWSQMLGRKLKNIHHTLRSWHQNFVVTVMRWLWMGRGVRENEQEMMECLHLCDINYFCPMFVAMSGFLNFANESIHKVIGQEQEQPDNTRNVVCALCWGLFTVLFQVNN